MYNKKSFIDRILCEKSYYKFNDIHPKLKKLIPSLLKNINIANYLLDLVNTKGNIYEIKERGFIKRIFFENLVKKILQMMININKDSNPNFCGSIYNINNKKENDIIRSKRINVSNKGIVSGPSLIYFEDNIFQPIQCSTFAHTLNESDVHTFNSFINIHSSNSMCQPLIIVSNGEEEFKFPGIHVVNFRKLLNAFIRFIVKSHKLNYNIQRKIILLNNISLSTKNIVNELVDILWFNRIALVYPERMDYIVIIRSIDNLIIPRNFTLDDFIHYFNDPHLISELIRI